MAFPESARLELPILQELLATGGEEKLNFLYQRLISYFPQLTEKDLSGRTNTQKEPWRQWRRLVHRAGSRLVKKGELERSKGRWTLTESGRQRAETERMLIEFSYSPSEAPQSSSSAKRTISHYGLQTMLVEIGRILGKYAEKEYQQEYQRYDVVWKESALSPRLSHVFEVQVKGKVESALAKLKHAYDMQRSKPILVISDVRDEKRARQFLQSYLSGSFHEIGEVTTVLGIQEVEHIYQALASVKEVLKEVLGEILA